MQIEGRTTSLLDCYAEMQLIFCKDKKKCVYIYMTQQKKLHELNHAAFYRCLRLDVERL